MYNLGDLCCICFYNKEHLQPLSGSDSDNITYFIKLISSVPEMCFNEMNDQLLVCKKCCETMDAAYKFRLRCLKSKIMLIDYISQLYHVSNISGAANLTDLNKFGDIKDEYQKEKYDMFIKEKTENEINSITEIKRENNQFNSKLIDTEHIQFENVVIETECEDKFYEEDVECFANPLVDKDDIKIDVSQNDIVFTPSTIKKENENQDLEYLQEGFDNILETCNGNNDDMISKVEENYHIYLRKCSDDPLTNLDEIKTDIVGSDIESVNAGINMQYKSEYIEECLTEDDVILLDDEKDEEVNFFHKSLEGNQKEISLSKKPKQKKCAVNRKDKMVKKYECNLCKKSFTQSSSVNIHMRIHTGEKPHVCDVCHKKFNQVQHLKKHIKTHTSEKSHECELCQKKFNELSAMRAHMTIHSGEKPHECDVCRKKFHLSQYLKEHMKIHIGAKQHKCDVCHKKFSQAYTLKMHMRIHTGEKLYECDLCQKKFIKLFNLGEHMKIHTGEKPYECEVCRQKLANSSNLKTHMRIHTGEKPYTCSVCLKKFNHLSTLTKHMRVHTGEKPYKCDVCHKSFTQSYSLKIHMRIHTGANLQKYSEVA